MVLLKRDGGYRGLSIVKNKKGELTTKQIVMIIVLITSFIIILFLFLRLNLGETSNKEICHNSVLLQEKSSLFSGPLDCRTNYMCVSGGGTCEGMAATSTVRVSTGDNQKNEIMKGLAEEMSDCWWMFGEGELNYIGRDISGRSACSICSIVEFDDRLQNRDPISYRDFYEYLRITQKTSTQTYLQYLYSTNVLDDIEREFNLEGYLEREIDPDKRYSLVTGMSRRFFFGGNHIPVVIMEVSSENYNAIGCDEFLTKA